MNGIEKITDRITQDTQAEIQALLTQAQQQAEQIVADCQAEAERIRTEILEKGQQELAAHRARLESMNQLDERKAVLAAKQAMVEEAFEAAIVRLCALPE
ncbi:MAG: V-type ATP synthase subunit E family protein, partial [Clostridiales bacterium]|nr:V-type ATP synthase subunit E family protein [Clostridiales bacterium]